MNQDIYYAVAHRTQEEIDSFKSRYSDFKKEFIPSIFKKALNLEVLDWKQSSSWGSSHVVFFVFIKGKKNPLVLRANLGFNKKPEVLMKIEQLITEKVSTIGVPTNKVLYVDVSRREYPFDFQIQEMLEGEDLEDHFKGSKEEYDRISFELGQYVAKYHSLKFDRFGRFNEAQALKGKLVGSKSTFFDYIIVCLDSDIEYLVKEKVLTSKKAKKVRGLFDDYKSIINIHKGSLLHHDLADHNIMFRNNKITGIFDWEAAVVGDPVLDLASCPTWKTHYPREEKLIEGYTSISKLPDNFEEKKNIYRLRTMLWKMVYAIRSGILNDARKEKFYKSLEPFYL